MTLALVTIIILFLFIYNNVLNAKEIEDGAKKYYDSFMEDDYVFLVHLKYGDSVDANELFGVRIRNAVLITFIFISIFLLSNFTFINVLVSVGIGFYVYKDPYMKLKRYYKANLSKVNLMLPYYLKSLEILVQHYTVPVALIKSIDTAPELFKSGLKELISKIEAGDSTVQPYMDFAIQYPVRDSMRMMRLLYRLSLGSQESKEEQLAMFARNVSSLQNKSREVKYQNRLETMEKKTMIMLFGTGGGIIILLFLAMFNMMSI